MAWHTYEFGIHVEVKFDAPPSSEDAAAAQVAVGSALDAVFPPLWPDWTPVGPGTNRVRLKGYQVRATASLTPKDLEEQAALAKELDAEVVLEARKLELVNTLLGLDVTDSLEHFEEVLRGALSEKFQ